MPTELLQHKGKVVVSDFIAPWWARNRHVQTIFPRFFQKRAALSYRREDFSLPDGDKVNLVWVGEPLAANALVVMFHGLEGSIDSHYCHNTAAYLQRQGFAVVVMHFRGCGGKPNLLARAYHSGETGDAWTLLNYLQQQYPDLPKLAIGFSLGANMLLKLLGERPEQRIIQGAMAVSAPLLLNECADSINHGFARRYQKYLLKSMLKNLSLKMQSIDYRGLINITEEQIPSIKTFRDFDQNITAPLHGFKDANDYYQRCSALPFLHKIKTPTLIIHAKDDPFMNENVLPKAEQLSAFVRVEVSEQGGHCGFMQGTPWSPEIWLQPRSARFFQSILASNNTVKNEKL
ncbi:hydrolase [Paraglaciecola hydrolytica]|uniref:Alpha/beta hydrolase n=1 Tax=Paraglaciecola hydrolytica TaxID=1799789 RepID=A0A136A5N3_9ALTE|nr:alpha/beta hydrolase [Paraglaciecola hydrolytica]